VNRRNLSLAALLLSVTPVSLPGYVQRAINNIGLHRSDFQSVKFSLNAAAVPGLTNASGHPFITTDSNVVGAIKAAMDTWNHVSDSNARFAPLTITSDINNEQDNKHVIVFRDTPEIQSIFNSNGALAITDTIFNPADGTITDTDILFNPALTFSTTLAASTYDIQAIATHELGHSLGANHTGILGATMFQTTAKGNSAERSLSSDDIAFVASLYPSNSSAYGTLNGSVTAGGSPVRGALVTAIDRTTGVAVGALSDLSTGRFAMDVPPGSYTLYAEPLSGTVGPNNLYIASLLPGQAIDTNFQPGQVANAPVYTVTPGSNVNTAISVESGSSKVGFQQSATGPAGGHGDTFMVVDGPQSVHSGGATDLLLFGPGIDTTLSESQLLLLGPASIRAGSLRRDDFSTTIMRLTLDVPARSTPTLASLLITKNGATAAFSGGLILLPPAPAFITGSITNAFSGSVNGVAPGEDVSIYGTNLGPAAGVGGSFDVKTGFATGVGGVSVTFDGIAAPLLYVSAGQINAQAPFELAGRTSTNLVVSYNGAVSAAVTAPVVPVHPGIYPKPINDDYSLNSASAPTQAGKYVTIYALGLGATSNQPGTGAPSPGQPLASTDANVSVIFGTTVVKPYFAGLSPGYVGLYQINVQVPQGLPTGKAVPLAVIANGASTQSGVDIYLK
jgi:uncharacterized protein (TIGR03437 family)